MQGITSRDSVQVVGRSGGGVVDLVVLDSHFIEHQLIDIDFPFVVRDKPESQKKNQQN